METPRPPLVLAITTSAAACAAAIHDADGERASEHLDLGKGHAERVVDVCATALERAGIDWADLTHVAVDVGPGSFTGVRAGVAAARGLALSLGIPAIGVSAADAVAADAPARPLAVLIDLRRERVALATFGATEIAPASMSVEEAAGMLAEDRWHVRGSAARSVADALLARGDEPLSVASATPTPSGVARASIARVVAGEAFTPPVPLYLRAADAVPAAPSPFATPSAERRFR